MLNLDLATIAKATSGRLSGANVSIKAVSTDSRNSVHQSLFVALRGEQHDAHDFVPAARENGAVAALLEREIDLDIPQIIVADAQRALGEIAGHVRRQRELCVIGITGSNGKTTVKSMLAEILKRHAPTHASLGSLNNEIGLPLTLLSMPEDTRFAVLEMGAGKPGDIAYLVDIAQPQVGLVNNIAPAHLERMGSLDGVAETKGALYAGLSADGVAVINADEPYAVYFEALAAEKKRIRFGLENNADVTARFVTGTSGSAFTLVSPVGEVAVQIPLLGLHNVRNALAAASLALAVGVPLDTIKIGLEATSAVPGRGAMRDHASGAVVIDDTYNANPSSFAAAIETLAACTGKRILVMGDMRELGVNAEQLHADIGSLAKRRGIDQLYAVGGLSRFATEAFGSASRHFADQVSLIEALRDELMPTVTVLAKGSRGSAMDRVVAGLFSTDQINGGRHAA